MFEPVMKHEMHCSCVLKVKAVLLLYLQYVQGCEYTAYIILGYTLLYMKSGASTEFDPFVSLLP